MDKTDLNICTKRIFLIALSGENSLKILIKINCTFWCKFDINFNQNFSNFKDCFLKK